MLDGLCFFLLWVRLARSTIRNRGDDVQVTAQREQLQHDAMYRQETLHMRGRGEPPKVRTGAIWMTAEVWQRVH